MTIHKGRKESVNILHYKLRGVVSIHTVAGIIDMLRYDRAWPATGADANVMHHFEPIDVQEFCVEGLDCSPERWKSFGFEVL